MIKWRYIHICAIETWSNSRSIATEHNKDGRSVLLVKADECIMASLPFHILSIFRVNLSIFHTLYLDYRQHKYGKVRKSLISLSQRDTIIQYPWFSLLVRRIVMVDKTLCRREMKSVDINCFIWMRWNVILFLNLG